jgi:bifunctional enzyme CysN/CysC
MSIRSRASASPELAARLAAHERRDVLRLLLCGSVDSGKSTLIGRLLYETKSLYADQLAALEADSKRSGTRGLEADFALVTDGLAAEREQRITIDVAYRHFATERRHFIVADAPGHEQYTRNMVTGASTAECAVLVVDAQTGITTQTCRHSFIVALLGIGHVLVAVNKMDLAGGDRRRFEAVRDDYLQVAERIGLEGVTCIPVSAALGENLVAPGAFDWFDGPTVLDYLEHVEVQQDLDSAAFRMPVQFVSRPSPEFRGYAGTVVSGTVAPGDEVTISPSGHRTSVARVVTADGDLSRGWAGQAVTVTLTDDVDASRGDLLAAADAPPEVADLLQATIVWMHEEPMLRGRSYRIRMGTAMATATIAPLKYKVNVDSLEHVAATKLELNEIGVCDLELSQPVAFDGYAENRDTGGFILIDRITNDTVGAGMIRFGLRRAQNLSWQELSIDRATRAQRKHQEPCVVWLTGLSGAGKSTIANLLEVELHGRGHHTYILDGDNVRHGLNRDLGFTDADRVENIRRVAEVARLMIDAGLIVIVSFISPFASERRMARSLFADNEFFELFVDTPLEVAEARDPKGLYRKARAGELRNFTGIDSPYEPPEAPELRLDTTRQSPADAVAAAIELLERRGLLPPGKVG